MKEKLVVIGNGMAGMKVVEELMERHADHFDITVFGAEPHGNYNRIMLSPVLGGEKKFDDIVIHDEAWYVRHNVRLHAGPGKNVVDIKRNQREVISEDGTTVGYDRLLIATGSTPVLLDVPGRELDGVMAFRSIADVDAMLSRVKPEGTAFVLGGGLLGLEAANGLAARGMDVTVIHHKKAILNRQLDGRAAALLQRALEARGVKFRLAAEVASLQGDADGHVETVTFTDGDTLPCSLFVMAIGIKPNIALARAAGIQSDHGILVDDTMQTFDPRVYAVGECVQHRRLTFGLVAPLYEQARVCANHLARMGISRYAYAPSGVRLKVSGIDLFSMGEIEAGKGSETLVLEDVQAGVYKKLVITNDVLAGVVLYGDTRHSAWYEELIESGDDVSAMRHALMFGPELAPAAFVSTVKEAKEVA